MSGRLILSSEILNDLLKTNSLTLQEKYQKNNGKNYYISPTIGLKLYNPKVSWIDAYKKNISFIFSKYENLSLLNFLKYVQEKLAELYKAKSYNPQNLSNIYYEKGDYFYVKTHLPNTYKSGIHYNIISVFNNEPEKFTVPKLGATYNYIIVDIRNIWEQNNLAGFNLELKETYVSI